MTIDESLVARLVKIIEDQAELLKHYAGLSSQPVPTESPQTQLLPNQPAQSSSNTLQDLSKFILYHEDDHTLFKLPEVVTTAAKDSASHCEALTEDAAAELLSIMIFYKLNGKDEVGIHRREILRDRFKIRKKDALPAIGIHWKKGYIPGKEMQKYFLANWAWERIEKALLSINHLDRFSIKWCGNWIKTFEGWRKPTRVSKSTEQPQPSAPTLVIGSSPFNSSSLLNSLESPLVATAPRPAAEHSSQAQAEPAPTQGAVMPSNQELRPTKLTEQQLPALVVDNTKQSEVTAQPSQPLSEKYLAFVKCVTLHNSITRMQVEFSKKYGYSLEQVLHAMRAPCADESGGNIDGVDEEIEGPMPGLKIPKLDHHDQKLIDLCLEKSEELHETLSKHQIDHSAVVDYCLHMLKAKAEQYRWARWR